MRHLYPMDRYRQLGESLGVYIRVNNPSTQQMQAFLGDFLANDELLLPLRDVVARPSFGALAALAGSGNGTVQRDAIVQELARSYLPAVVSNVKRVLTGMLALTDHGDLQALHPLTAARTKKICGVQKHKNNSIRLVPEVELPSIS